MKEKVSLWIGIVVLVSAILFLPFGSITGNPILTNDTTPPVLNIISSGVNSNDVATINYYTYDPESGVSSVWVYGPIESTGLIRGSRWCNNNASCTGTFMFSYEPTFDNNGNTYRVVSNSTSGITLGSVTLVFNGEGNGTSCTNECNVSGEKKCAPITPTNSEYSQTCGNYDSDSCLEWSSMTLCPYGCSNGICNSAPGNQTNTTSCTDTDGGLSYYVKGNTYGVSVDGTTWNKWDSCTGSILEEFSCNGNLPASPVDYTCSYGCYDGACIKSVLQGFNYSIELISATDTSATLKVTNRVGASETKEILEILESSWESINGLMTYLIEADETIGYVSAGTKYSLDLSIGGLYPSLTTLTFKATAYSAPIAVELITATDTSATIKVTNLEVQMSETKEVTEGTTETIKYINVMVSSADETNSTLTANIFVEPFSLENRQPFCSDSDGGVNYNVKGVVTTENGDYTDYCFSDARNLVEYSCLGTAKTNQTYSCPKGCDVAKGQCKAAPPKKKSTCKSIYCAMRDFLTGKSKI
ncbi:MAG TPA: hypothetical protein VJH92_04660 [Candidatus Nanoarchaeia archaeon]|nr:hypothetical protein [Candidatus Nanoarchaeia archaeon]